MSTKIYGGLRWQAATGDQTITAADLIALGRRLRRVLVDTQADVFRALVADTFLDAGHTDTGDWKTIGAARSWALEEAAKAAASPRRSAAWIDAQVVLVLDPEGGPYVYGLCPGPTEIHTALTDTLHGEDYAWWNGTDRPDDVTARDWTEREQVWRRVLDDFNLASADAGVIVAVDVDKAWQHRPADDPAVWAAALDAARARRARIERVAARFRERLADRS